jgi:anaerobic ribonucleoside-triphosphate reductase activating protein
MRYAAIRSLDVTNGEGTGVSLFVQGCPFHCYQCFNPETWSFDGGKEWTDETEEQFIELA